MFKNLKITMKMGSPIAAIHPIYLDAILSAAKAKEILGDEFYSGKNVVGSKEMIDKMLSPILDKKYGVYCASCGIGDYREFIGSWAKRWESQNDDIVRFKEKTKKRVDIGAGYFKNYHMPLVLKAYKEIVFYARGHMKEIERLLRTYIFHLGKKASQGYGEIRDIIVEEIKEDYSLFKDRKLMRPIPVRNIEDYISEKINNGKLHAASKPIIPPYWRNDNREMCLMPDI